MYKVVSIILASVLLLSCNNKAAIDLTGFEPSEGSIELIGKWRLVKMVAEDGSIVMEEDEEVSDEEGIFIEFFSNGKVDRIFAYLDDGDLVEDIASDTYTVSQDGRTITTVNEDEGTSILLIIELTSTSLNLEELVEGVMHKSYYTKIL